MDAMTPRSRSGPTGRRRGAAGRGRIERFDRTERAVHWATTLLVLTLVATGAILYLPSLSVTVGRRLLVEDTHVYVGVAVFVPLLAGVLGRWGRSLRSDLRAMSRLTDAELSWLRSLGRLGRGAVGKFNPGQKLNTNAVAGMLTVLFLTGLALRWGNFLPVGLRTGATFIHDLFALGFVVLITGHIGLAIAHPRALRSMVTGWVPAGWAERHAPAWRPVRTAPDEHAVPPTSVSG